MVISVSQNKEIKHQALELIEESLKDLSPDQKHPLKFMCGFEREGVFVPPANEIPPPQNRNTWLNDALAVMKGYATRFNDALRDNPNLKEICTEPSGTFMLEAVTKPLELTTATIAIENISTELLRKAGNVGITSAGFGNIPAHIVDIINAKAHLNGHLNFAREAFKNYNGEIREDGPSEKTFMGRGQHCNLSVWMGDKNLFAPEEGYGEQSHDLLNQAAAVSLDWLPHAFLISRKGNYHRIEADRSGGVHRFSIGFPDTSRGDHALLHRMDLTTLRHFDRNSSRLEFRHATAEADPVDVAIASALPVLKACDEHYQKAESGRIELDDKGTPITLHKGAFPSKRSQPVPPTEKEARKLFNAKENPYFSFLNELAERKIETAEFHNMFQPSAQNAERLRGARKFKGIGTRLYGEYCKEYGIDGPDQAISFQSTHAAAHSSFALR